MNLIKRMYAYRERGAVALISMLLCLLFSLWLFPRAALKSGSCENNVVALQKSCAVDDFRGVLQAWSKTKDNAVAVVRLENIIKLDFAFPVIYALFLAFAYAWARGNAAPGPLDRALFLAPFVAGLFDWVENVAHLYLLRDVNRAADVERAAFPPALVFTASAFAHAKYLLLIAVTLAILYVLARGRWSARRAEAAQ